MALPTTYFILSIFAGFALVSSKCPKTNTTLSYTSAWKVKVSDVVLHGVVNSTEPDQMFPQNKDVYSVNFQVRCIYKGAPLEENIRINKVGYNKNTCLTTSLTVSHTYIVYLKKTGDGQFEQAFQPDEGNSQNYEELTIVCGIEVSYPNGIDENNKKETCDEAYAEECVGVQTTDIPPNVNNVDDQSDSADTKNQQQNDDDDQGYGIPNKSGSTGIDADDDDGSGSATLKLHTLALGCLFLVMIFN